MTDSPSEGRSLTISTLAAAIGGTGSLVSPELAFAGAALTPVIESSLTYAFQWFPRRRHKQAENMAETLIDAAEEGSSGETETRNKLRDILEAVENNDEYNELFTRVLSIAQDAAMREKRRALSRALAGSVQDMGTVYSELAFVRDLADIQPVHLRLLRIMRTRPKHLDKVAEQMNRLDDELAAAQWMPWSLIQAAPELENVIAWPLEDLERLGLIYNRGSFHAPVDAPDGGYGNFQPLWEITSKGEWFLERLSEPEGQPEVTH